MRNTGLLLVAFVLALASLMVLTSCARKVAPTPQALQGGDYYSHHCLPCHGLELGGGVAPALAGKHFIEEAREHGYDNAGELYEFITENMPPSTPGSLSTEKYWAIVAHILRENGVELPSNLTEGNARGVNIH